MKPLFCCYLLHSFGKIQIYRNDIEIFWIQTTAFKNSLFAGGERTKQLSVEHALCDRLITQVKNKPFEHCSIISFAKLDTTISTHSTNIRSAVQKSCCSYTDSIIALSFTSLRFFARLGRFSLVPLLVPAGWLEVFAPLVLPITIISVKRRPALKEIRQNGKTVEC